VNVKSHVGHYMHTTDAKMYYISQLIYLVERKSP